MNEQPLIGETQEKILSLSAETQFAPDGIVSRTVLRTPGQRVVLFGFAEGQELTEHTSAQTAIVQILTGECEFILAGKSHPLKSGDLNRSSKKRVRVWPVCRARPGSKTEFWAQPTRKLRRLPFIIDPFTELVGIAVRTAHPQGGDEANAVSSLVL